MEINNKHKLIEEKVQKALDFVEKDGYKSNPFIHTRIKQQIANQKISPPPTAFSMAVLWKPALAVFLIALNVYVFLDTRSGQKSSYDTLADEYGWVAESQFSDYINYE